MMPWWEVPCIVGSDGPEALAQGKIPSFQQALMFQQVTVEKLVVEAYVEKELPKNVAGVNPFQNHS